MRFPMLLLSVAALAGRSSHADEARVLPVAPDSFFLSCNTGSETAMTCRPEGARAPSPYVTFTRTTWWPSTENPSRSPEHDADMTARAFMQVHGKEALTVRKARARIGSIDAEERVVEGSTRRHDILAFKVGPDVQVVECDASGVPRATELCERGLGLVVTRGIPKYLPVERVSVFGHELSAKGCNIVRARVDDGLAECDAATFSWDVGNGPLSDEQFPCVVFGGPATCSIEPAFLLGGSNVRAVRRDGPNRYYLTCETRTRFTPGSALPAPCAAFIGPR